jgi:mycothiol synthase
MPGEVVRAPRGWQVDVALAPGEDLGDAVEEALHDVRRAGGGPVTVWVHGADDRSDAVLATFGLAAARDLHQMRRPLPVGEAYDLETRPFVPGSDDAAWLAVNNRAFRWHPEQGGWGTEQLGARVAEPWFDPAGFLLHEVGGELAGFCWTKVHADESPPLGEIFVIAVDPRFAGRGLGRALTLAGLDHLFSERGTPIGMLYVDASNEPALRLYLDLGFEVHRTDRAYAGRV